MNRPSAISISIIVLVLLHFFASQKFHFLNVSAVLSASEPDSSALLSLALGVATVSAMVGGFAGVIIIFALGTENQRFRTLRLIGGNRLRSNWISTVINPLVSAFGALASATVILGYHNEAGLWILEACLFFAAHGAIRLTALLWGLTKVVHGSDNDHNSAPKKSKRIAFKDISPG